MTDKEEIEFARLKSARDTLLITIARLHGEIDALKERLAQPEQEPVAWGVFEGNLHDMFFTQEEAQEMAKLKGTHAKVKPLYTTPPQRTWVWLTDEDIGDAYVAWDDADGASFADFARAIEAKLKQKNGYAEEKNT
jgi:hypothetical protein